MGALPNPRPGTGAVLDGERSGITVTQATFAKLELPVTEVFITENEINFLAFPDVQAAMVIFGAGYGFENLASVEWLRNRVIHYWGDIDTHGFAILNQLRRYFPQAASLLMDRETLMEHQVLWGVEPSPDWCAYPTDC